MTKKKASRKKLIPYTDYIPITIGFTLENMKLNHPVKGYEGFYQAVYVAATAYIESGDGKSSLTTQYNNYFGIKPFGKYQTTERTYQNKELRSDNSKYAAFANYSESIKAYEEILSFKRYGDYMERYAKMNSIQDFSILTWIKWTGGYFTSYIRSYNMFDALKIMFSRLMGNDVELKNINKTLKIKVDIQWLTDTILYLDEHRRAYAFIFTSHLPRWIQNENNRRETVRGLGIKDFATFSPSLKARLPCTLNLTQVFAKQVRILEMILNGNNDPDVQDLLSLYLTNISKTGFAYKGSTALKSKIINNDLDSTLEGRYSLANGKTQNAKIVRKITVREPSVTGDSPEDLKQLKSKTEKLLDAINEDVMVQVETIIYEDPYKRAYLAPINKLLF